MYVYIIGTVYPNSSFSTNRIIIFSRSSPKDPMGTLARSMHDHHGPMHAYQAAVANSQ